MAGGWQEEKEQEKKDRKVAEGEQRRGELREKRGVASEAGQGAPPSAGVAQAARLLPRPVPSCGRQHPRHV